MTLKGQQLAAVTAQESEILVSAAAGSGKTTVLTERIMEMICRQDNPVDIDRLLVVTFTDAAAKQMRAKISEKLMQRLKLDFGNIHLQRQINLLNKAQIMTIHSFCLTVVRRFFHVLEIDPAFRVGDTAEIELLQAEVVDEVFERNYQAYYERGENPAFSAALAHFAQKIDDSGFKKLVLDIFEYAYSCPSPHAWLDEHAASFEMTGGIGSSRWYADFKAHMQMVLNSSIANLQDLSQIAANPNLPQKNADVLADDIACLKRMSAALEDGFEAFYASVDFEPGKLSSERARAVDGSMDLDEIKALRERFSAARKQYFSDVVKDIRENLLIKPLHEMEADLLACGDVAAELRRLVMEFAADYAAAKVERNIVDFSDFEHFCLAVLGKIHDGEFIPSAHASEISALFDEVFVDEYQDSSMIQELILKTVAGVGRRFMVGDIKQSIYRFRLARPEVFVEKYNRFSDIAGGSERLITLSENFRSRQNIIDGINWIFGQLMSETAGDVSYTGDARLRYGADFAAPVFDDRTILHIIDNSSEAPATNDDDEITDLDRAEIEAKAAVQYIRNLIAGKSQVRDGKEYRDIRYSDIVILLRAKAAGRVFVEEMKNQNIPALCEGENDYFSATEVLTVLAMLKIIDNPRQDEPLISCMYSPMFRFKADELVEIRAGHTDFYGCVVDYSKNGSDEALRIKVTQFLTKLELWRDWAVHLPASRLVLALYEDTGFFDYAGLLPGGNIRQANLNLLFEKAIEFEKTSLMGLFNFVRYIEKLQKRNFGFESAKTASEGENLVRVMTIHKSKGLEFPVVLVCDLGKRLNKRDAHGSFLMHWDLGFGFKSIQNSVISNTFARYVLAQRIETESISEELRVLYVALTRAKEKLILIGTVSNFSKTIEKYDKISKSNVEQIAPYEVLGGKSYIDWLIMAMMRHNDFRDVLQEHGGSSIGLNDNSRWQVQISAPAQSKANLKEKAKSYNDLTQLLNEIENRNPSPANAEIERRLSFRYAYESGVAAPSKMSVSEVKRLYWREIMGAGDVSDYFTHKPEFEMPEFMQSGAEQSGAERGIIFHKTLEHLDISMPAANLPQFLIELESRGILQPGEIDCVNISQLADFLASPIAHRMRHAVKIHKELNFTIGINPALIDTNLHNAESEMMLHGVIDCIIEEEDGIVILDYKTDRIPSAGLEFAANQYRGQMILYKMAAQKVFGKDVKEMILWFFAAGDCVILTQ